MSRGSYASNVRRVLSPTYGARSNAAEALERMAEESYGLAPADLALLSGHPAGSSQRRAAGRLGTALWEVFPGSVALLDRDGVVVSVNRHWRQFGLERGGSATSELGTNYLDICARARDEEPEAARAGAMVEAALRGEWPELRLEYPCGEEPDGGTRWYALQAIPIPGKHSGALVVHIDVTPYVQRERMWQHRATHDDLTGLPNRTLVLDRLTHALHVAERDLSALAVLFLDLDGFKAVNDQLGHDAGDEILRAVARRLETCVRAADTVGRWAGDEFLVVADRLRDRHEAEELAERIRWSLARPIDVAGAAPSAVTVSASIGIAHRDARHRSAGALVHAADMALVEGRLAAGRAGRR